MGHRARVPDDFGAIKVYCIVLYCMFVYFYVIDIPETLFLTMVVAAEFVLVCLERCCFDDFAASISPPVVQKRISAWVTHNNNNNILYLYTLSREETLFQVCLQRYKFDMQTKNIINDDNR